MRIAKAAPRLKIVSATPVTAGCRMIKSDHELELMRLANQVTLTAYQAAYQTLHDGMTQAELERMIMAAYSQLGFPGEVDIEIGENSSFPHGSIVPQVIREGTLVHAGRRLHRRRISVRHHAHVRLRQSLQTR